MRVRNITDGGFTFVEIMIAVSLLLTSATAGTWAYAQLKTNNERMSLISSVSAIEAAMSTAFVNEDNYPAAVKAEIAAGSNPPPSLQFPITGQSMGNSFNFTLRPGTPVTLSDQLQACTGFPSDTCPIFLEIGVSNVGGRVGFAYRILARKAKVALNYSGAGATGEPGAAFAPDDFSITLPGEYYLESLMLACPAGSVAIHGIDATTGVLKCIKQPLLICPNRTLPKSLRFDSASESVEIDCGAPAQNASCPANYFMQSINTTSLDAGGTKSGVCVYAGRSPAPYGIVGPAKRITGRVCPDGYRSQSVCRIAASTVTSTTGSCSWCSASTPNCSAKTVVNSPPGTYTKTIPNMCGDSTPRSMPGNAGSAVMVSENSPVGHVDCRMMRAQQDCGATWNGDVEVDVTCVLDTSVIPETTSAL